MNHSPSRRSRWIGQRPMALLLSASLVTPMIAGCGGNNNQAAAPPLDATRGEAPMAPRGNGNMQTNNNQGMSTGKKTMIALAGAAALYYMYKKNRDQNNRPLPQGVQYYQSKNGRIYYRDPQTKQAVWVTPPTQQNAFMVPQDELQGLNLDQFRGYNNRDTGRTDFKGLIPMG